MKKIILYISLIALATSPIKEVSAANLFTWLFESIQAPFGESFFWKTVTVLGVTIASIPLAERVWRYVKKTGVQSPEQARKEIPIQNTDELEELKATVEALKRQLEAPNAHEKDKGKEPEHDEEHALKKKQIELEKLLEDYIKKEEVMQLTAKESEEFRNNFYLPTLTKLQEIEKKYSNNSDELSTSIRDVSQDLIARANDLDKKVKEIEEKKDKQYKYLFDLLKIIKETDIPNVEIFRNKISSLENKMSKFKRKLAKKLEQGSGAGKKQDEVSADFYEITVSPRDD